METINIKRLLDKLNNSNRPIYVTLKPESQATEKNCFYNVQDKVLTDNGEIIFGWKLHQNKYFYEAERHAVWRSPLSTLIDITPDTSYTDVILFLLEDKNWTYDGQRTGNVRLNITTNKIVDDLILVYETIDKLRNTEKRISRTETKMDERLYNCMNFFIADNEKRKQFILLNKSITDLCYCGKRIEYKDCHGKDLHLMDIKITDKISQLR